MRKPLHASMQCMPVPTYGRGEREECWWKLTPGSVLLVLVPSATVCDRVVGKATHCVGASIWWVQIWTDERREGISAKSHPWSSTLPVYSVVSFRFGPRGDSTFQLERVRSKEATSGC